MLLQIVVDGFILGGLYAAIAGGFSLVWGVLNIINLLHGSLIVLGAYVAFFAYQWLGLNPFLFAPLAGLLLFPLGYAVQRLAINRVMDKPVLLTLTLTFGLNLILDNLLLMAFKADYRRIVLDHALGLVQIGPVILPLDRCLAAALALLLILSLWLVMRFTQFGRAIVAVRMDAEAAALMGVDVPRVYALTFGLAAAIAGAAGSLLAAIMPISPLVSSGYLGKAFIICILGGLGSIPGVIVGGLAIGVIENLAVLVFGPDHTLTVGFVLLLLLLRFRPMGLFGRRAYQ
jgi:branched-chain amino acid transport system permease protein